MLTGNSVRDQRAKLQSEMDARKVRLQECYCNVSHDVGKMLKLEVEIFRQTAANFSTEKVLVLGISILTQSPK